MLKISLQLTFNEFTTLSFDASADTFCSIMSCLNGDLEVASRLCLFINNCFQIRSDFYNNAKEINILRRPETTQTRSGRISKRPTVFDHTSTVEIHHN